MSPQECMENALWPKELAPSARVRLVVKLRAVETVLMEAPVIRDEPNHNRCVMTIADGEAFAIYRRIEKALVISHTEVPRAARGRGVGAQLAGAIFDHARKHGDRIVPACSFIADWARRHPEYKDVLVHPNKGN